MTKAIVIQAGRGKGRDPYKIREFLSGKGLSMSKVARKAKTYPHIAQETINGVRNHHRVLGILEELGCPKEFLYGDQNNNERRAV